MIAVGSLRWRTYLRFRPPELDAAQRRIAELTRERDVAVAKLAGASRSIAEDRTELRAARDELVELRRHRRALVRAVRDRSSQSLPADLVALIEEGALGE